MSLPWEEDPMEEAARLANQQIEDRRVIDALVGDATLYLTVADTITASYCGLRWDWCEKLGEPHQCGKLRGHTCGCRCSRCGIVIEHL